MLLWMVLTRILGFSRTERVVAPMLPWAKYCRLSTIHVEKTVLFFFILTLTRQIPIPEVATVLRRRDDPPKLMTGMRLMLNAYASCYTGARFVPDLRFGNKKKAQA